jgi:hypothetical protein
MLRKRWRDLAAGDGSIFSEVRCHWLHGAMLGTGWSRDHMKWLHPIEEIVVAAAAHANAILN